MKNILEFDSLYLEFGLHKVLQDIYVKCEQGEVVGLIGRNGCGKSSLMKIVFGSLKAYQQSVRINGNYLLDTNIRKGYIGYLPQESFIPGSLKLNTVLSHYNLSPAEFFNDFPHLQNSLHHRISQLSGGEIRLVELFLILKQPNQFCILDEPFSNLMPLHIEKAITLIESCKKEKGILVTDHLFKHILSISDRMYMLLNGKTYSVKREEDLIQFGYLPC